MIDSENRRIFRGGMMPVARWPGWFLGMFLGAVLGCSSESPPQDLPPIQSELTTGLGFDAGTPRQGVPASNDPGPEDLPLNPDLRVAVNDPEGFTADPAYRALNRFELPALRKSSRNRILMLKEAPPEVETLTVREKPLVLAGRGFEIHSFEQVAQHHLVMDPTRFLLPDPPTPHITLRAERLDPSGEFMTSRKPLIFHEKAIGFSAEPPPRKDLPTRPPEPEPPVALKPIPETRVLLAQDERAGIQLVPAERRLDLLGGHPALNRKYFERDFR